MLITASKLQNCPVLSLHVGSRIASVTHLIVNPNDLSLIACRVNGPLVGKEAGNILLMRSVREFSRLGMILDSIDELVEAEDVVHVRDILKLNFSLTGLKVESKDGAKLGKVTDFTLDPDTWEVRQLIVQRPFMKSFIDPELIIPREQIIEVDDYRVVVKAEKETGMRSHAQSKFTPNFVNPFREPDFAESEVDEP